MYDYNFFEHYKSKKKTNKDGNGLVSLVFLIGIVVLGVITANSYFQNGLIVKDNLEMSTELALAENVELFSRIESKQTLNIQLKDMSANLIVASSVIDQREVIRIELINNLVLSLPSDAQILNLSIDQGMITLNGVAAQRSAIAEFQKNLRDTGVFPLITVAGINTQEDDFSFDMSITLGGIIDENIN